MSKHEPRSDEISEALRALNLKPQWKLRGDKLYLVLNHTFSSMPEYGKLKVIVEGWYPFAYLTSFGTRQATFRVD